MPWRGHAACRSGWPRRPSRPPAQTRGARMTTASLPCALRSALLTLLLAACSGPASGNDTALAAQVRQALVETPGLRSETVQVQSRDGAVRLSGTADTDEAAAQALAAARSVPGVRDVRNEIRVRDPL
ncbi:BON domain-containing protein [Bordetella bronchiseptica]|uniref:BON domain-containing protein n=2 Tax=Alcaligenaceae TaxID=506 RepID=A0ABX4FIG0_9BORD|nr:BON domain-containing protein [Bordetella bronchiseptica]MBN3269536.1 BON domain-containing protein [Bordetella bronchiseptica]OZI82000.1 hypothetical protein CAL23_09970 [Bordetella genomosp. 6]